MDNIRREFDNAIERVMTCNPDYIVMGMSAETFWDGLEESFGSASALNCLDAVSPWDRMLRRPLRCYGDIKKICVITPYWPVGVNVKKFFEDCGFEFGDQGSKCDSPANIAQVTEAQLMDAW